MKLFKKIFGSENKKSKYESNTLAEVNESPDKSKDEEKTAAPSKAKKDTVKKATTSAAKTEEEKSLAVNTSEK